MTRNIAWRMVCGVQYQDMMGSHLISSAAAAAPLRTAADAPKAVWNQPSSSSPVENQRCLWAAPRPAMRAPYPALKSNVSTRQLSGALRTPLEQQIAAEQHHLGLVLRAAELVMSTVAISKCREPRGSPHGYRT